MEIIIFERIKGSDIKAEYVVDFLKKKNFEIISSINGQHFKGGSVPSVFILRKEKKSLTIIEKQDISLYPQNCKKEIEEIMEKLKEDFLIKIKN